MQFSANYVPWVWAVIALVVAAFEFQAPGSYLIWVACAAGVTAIASFLGADTLSMQLMIFSIAVVVSCVAGYFVYRRLDMAPATTGPLNRRDLDLVGTIGTAAETFVNGQGKARIGDSVWLAEAREDIAAGAPILVEAVKGTTLIVCRRPGTV